MPGKGRPARKRLPLVCVPARRQNRCGARTVTNQADSRLINQDEFIGACFRNRTGIRKPGAAGEQGWQGNVNQDLW